MPEQTDGLRYDILRGRDTLSGHLDRLTRKARNLARVLKDTQGGVTGRQRRRGQPVLTPAQEAQRDISAAAAQKRGIAAQRGVVREQGRLVDDRARVERRARALRVDSSVYRGLSTADARALRAGVAAHNIRTGAIRAPGIPQGLDPQTRKLLQQGFANARGGRAAPRDGFVGGIREAISGDAGMSVLDMLALGGGSGAGGRVGAAFLSRFFGKKRVAGPSFFDAGRHWTHSFASGAPRWAISRGPAPLLGLKAGMGIGLAATGVGALAGIQMMTQPAVAEHEQYMVQLRATLGGLAGPAYGSLIGASLPSRYGPADFIRTGVQLSMLGNPTRIAEMATLVSSISEARGQTDTSQAARAVQGMLIKGKLDQEVLEPLRTLGVDFPMIYKRFLLQDSTEGRSKDYKDYIERVRSGEVTDAQFRRDFFESSARGQIREEEVLRILDYMGRVEFKPGVAAGTWHQVLSTASGQINLFLKAWGDFMGDLGLKGLVTGIGDAAQVGTGFFTAETEKEKWDKKTGISTSARRIAEASWNPFGESMQESLKLQVAPSMVDGEVRVIVETAEGEILNDTTVSATRAGRNNITVNPHTR